MQDRTASIAEPRVVWGKLFDLHTAVLRSDVAEISTQLITFAGDEFTRNHLATAGDFLFALARSGEDPSDFNAMMLDSYLETYMDSYNRIVGELAQTAAGPAQSTHSTA